MAAGSGGRGLALSVQPVWGKTASGVDALWDRGIGAPPAAGGAPMPSVEATLGYGLAAFGEQGLLTPYAGLSLSGTGTR